MFAELMLDVMAESGPEAAVPPTIYAFLRARLDHLPPDDRKLLQRAAVIGREFTWEQLCALLGGEDEPNTDAAELLRRLQRNRFIQRAGVAGTFRFTQALVRDAVYSMAPKSSRERWHLRMADWISSRNEPGSRFPGAPPADFLGYHLEAACLLRRALRPGDPDLPHLGARAAGVLAAEGTRALHRKDLPAAAALLERSRDLLPAGHPEHRLIALRISDAWLGLWNAQRALAALDEAERAAAGKRTRRTCQVQRGILAMRMGLTPLTAISADVDRIAATLDTDPGDDVSWCRLQQLRAYLFVSGEQLGAAEAALREALSRARSMDSRYEEQRILSDICQLALWGPSHVSDGLALSAELFERFEGDRASLVPVITSRAGLLVLKGDIDGARACLAVARSHIRDLRLDRAAAVTTQIAGLVESLAGAHPAAEHEFRTGAVALRAAGQVRGAQTLEACAARAAFEQGRLADVLESLDSLEAHASETDRRTQLIIKSIRGRVASAGGSPRQAIAVLREAERLAAGTDDLCLRGDVLSDLGVVLRSAGLAAESEVAMSGALDLYVAKGADLLAARARSWLTERGGEPDARQGEPA